MRYLRWENHQQTARPLARITTTKWDPTHAPLLPGSHLYTLIKNSHREIQSHVYISNSCAELYSPERKSRIEVVVREAVFYGVNKEKCK